MAKAEDIDVSPDEPYRRAGARVVRVRTRELFDHTEGVLDTRDIERVHDMRVASRRLRAVLEIFAPCFPQGEFKGVLRDVKQLADANKPGVERLLKDLRARQSRANEALAAALERAQERGLHERLLALADEA